MKMLYIALLTLTTTSVFASGKTLLCQYQEYIGQGPELHSLSSFEIDTTVKNDHNGSYLEFKHGDQYFPFYVSYKEGYVKQRIKGIGTDKIKFVTNTYLAKETQTLDLKKNTLQIVTKYTLAYYSENNIIALTPKIFDKETVKYTCIER